MKNPVLDVRTVVVKAIPIYRCGECGASGEGSTVRFECSSLEELPRLGERVSVDHIPVGWSAQGRGKIRCPRCTPA